MDLIYRMSFPRIVEDYIDIDDSEFADIEMACIQSAPQHIRTESMTVNTSDRGGLLYPDFYYNNAVALVSPRFKELLNGMEDSNVFYKDVYVKSAMDGALHSYYLALPPRIACADMERSEYVVVKQRPRELRKYSRLVIVEERARQNDLFKVANALDNSIYVSQRLHDLVLEEQLQGIAFQEVCSS